MKEKKYTMDNIETLVEDLKKYNEAYRKGSPLISDREYDDLVEKLEQLQPDHEFLTAVEPEVLDLKKEVRHPAPMLSTEKAYTGEDLARFVARVEKNAQEIGVTKITFRVTPKLDGLAGRDDGKVFATRGNGHVGYEISNAWDKGVIPEGGRGLGLGEIVVVESYFRENLTDSFEHPRNMAVGIVSSDKVSEYAVKALADGVVRFVPYATLDSWTGSGEELLAATDEIIADLTEKVDYPLDGMVAEVVEEDVRAYMGATSHHYRWQIAIKSRGETAVTTVEKVSWQVGRTGNVTPVMEVSPVSVSGATIRRVTAHNAGLIKKLNIGEGAEIEIIRSGEVIPKLEQVLKDAENVVLPELCPVCKTPLSWNNDFLKCDNYDCTAQVEKRISHWFKTLGNADWFGIKTIERLVKHEYDSLEKIYAMERKHFMELGFGPVQSVNLSEATRISRTKAVEDWRFLAAFGIPNLGKGDSRNLLAHVEIKDIPDVTADGIAKIHGFAEVTSKGIEEGIKVLKDTILHMLEMEFNLMRTPLARELASLENPISGKGVVFTGKMESGSRDDMQAEARKLGAKVQTSVSGKTDFLVCGAKVGASKTAKAEKSGAKVISEAEYLEMIKN